ncbi:DM13 domain-containing protein [Nocardioides sp.]|uniref:DM13 domain-containing protein n=1 Tax=Nocardioides sp. TaxID=35761 RepID=UPI0035698C75
MRRWLITGLVAAVCGAGLWAFQPWRAWTSSEIDEALPQSSPSSSPATTASPTVPASSGSPSDASPSPSSSPPPRDRVLAAGRFEAAEYATSGRARVIELADGRRFLRLEELATSDGPDLKVWITDQPSGGSWGSYDDGRWVGLGDLKATHGNQNYEIPADARLRGLVSVVIWCDRFNVAFGTAPVAL